MENVIETQANNVNKSGFLPTKEVELNNLPSKGRGYNSNAKISIRPYSFGEVKRISDSKLSMNEKLQTIVSGVSTNFDKDKLTLSDVVYLGMIRKLNTLSTFTALYPYDCPNCGTHNDHKFTQNDIEIEDLEAEELPLSVTMSDGKIYEFEPITYKDMIDIGDGKYDKHVPSKNVLKDKVAIYALLCKNQKFEDSYYFFNYTMDQDDHDVLNEIDMMLSHDVKPLNSTCTNCKTQISLPLKNAIDMVLPFRENKRHVRDRISFGKRTIPIGE